MSCKPKRTSTEFLGVWERLNSPGLNSIEFDRIRKQASSVNEIAISQMRTLLADSNVKRLK